MSILRDFWNSIVGNDPAANSGAPTEMPPTEPYPYGPPGSPQMPEIPKAPRLPDIPEPPPEGFAEPPPGGTLGAESTEVCAEASEFPQVSLENPEMPAGEWGEGYQVDAETEEVLAKIARGEMTAEEAMAEGATEATTEAGAEVATEAGVEVATEAGVETATEVGVETAAGEVTGEGLLAGAAPVAIPVAVGVGVFLAGESEVVSEDEEQAMLAESRRQQAAREAAAEAARAPEAQ